ncbi:hypothetical protein PLESTF_000129800 [Pleodorina starrii]|nr:hypothetical protein PLESTM_000170200 [Pleodorina starrii]GLC64149.1 hypothetical protein PLESTF_000129800 [Pleodorina starrii]
MFVVQGLSWFAGLAHGMKAEPELRGIVSGLTHPESGSAEQVKAGGQDDLRIEDIPVEDLPGGPGSRKLLTNILAGPLPGLTVIPGFPGPKPFTPGSLGFLGRMGVVGAGTAALAQYVVSGQDPVAIALRQLSIVAIESYGTAVQNAIKRGVAQIDAQLARYSSFLKRQASALKKKDAQDLLAAVQMEIRALVIARAALKDMSAREVANVKFLTSAASSWTSWFYGIQYRFTTLTININWSNDPLQLELNRVLFSLGDVTKLVGLLLKPFIDAWKFEQRFFNTLYNIIFKAYVRERNRLTITPVATLMYRFGSGQNIQFIIDRVTSLSQALGGGANADAMLAAARAARDQVAAALMPPGAGGGGSMKGAAGGQLQGLERLAEMLRNRAASG